jgi:hypothetical protein
MPLLANINVGTSPNDGTGDSIRESFIIVNENFQFIEQFFPNTSTANLNANITSNGTSFFNTVNIGGVLTSTSNISASGYFIGNGSQLTGVSASTAQYVTANAQANITSVGTLSSLTVTGNVTASGYSGTIITPAQPNITSVGTLSTLSVAGNTTVSGNIVTSDLVFIGNVGRPKISANAAIIDKVGLIVYETSILTAANIAFANINFANTFALTYGYRVANANVTFNYGNITTGSNFTLHLKNTNGATIYALLPNNTNNKGSNTVPVTANTVATFTFMCYDTTAANVVATIIN